MQYHLNSQWVVDYDPYSFYPDFVSVVDTGTLWFLGVLPGDSVDIMTKTPEYGWQYGNGNDLPVNVQYLCIAGINSSTAFIGDAEGHVYKSTNHGWGNWTNILNAGTNYWIVDIKFSKIHKNTGYIFCCKNDYSGGAAKVYKTTNYGNTWQLFTPDLGNYGFANKLSTWVTDSSHAWISLSCNLPNCLTTKIVYTTNGGTNWVTTDIEANRTGVQSIAFSYDNQVGILSTYKSWTSQRLFRTTNRGLNWNFYDTVFTGNILALITVPETSVWYMSGDAFYPNTTGYMSYELKSSNNGLNWIKLTSEDSTDIYGDMDAVTLDNKIYVWAACGDKVMKLIDTAVIIGIENEGIVIPKDFELEQNFPNPFNPVTKISYKISKGSSIKIKVYNLSGQKIKDLLNEYKAAGEYEIEFDASELASGVYFYSIEADKFVQSKKMVLLK